MESNVRYVLLFASSLFLFACPNPPEHEHQYCYDFCTTQMTVEAIACRIECVRAYEAFQACMDGDPLYDNTEHCFELIEKYEE